MASTDVRRGRGNSGKLAHDIRSLLPSSTRRKAQAAELYGAGKGAAEQNRPPVSRQGLKSDGVRPDASTIAATAARDEVSSEIRTAVVRQMDGAPLLPFRKSFSSSPLRKHSIKRELTSEETANWERYSPPPSPDVYQFSSLLKYVKKSHDSLRSSDEDDVPTKQQHVAALRTDQAPPPLGVEVPGARVKNSVSAKDTKQLPGPHGRSGSQKPRPRSAPIYPPTLSYALTELRSPTSNTAHPALTEQRATSPNGQANGPKKNLADAQPYEQRPTNQWSTFVATDSQQRRKSLGLDSAIGLDEQLSPLGQSSVSSAGLSSPPYHLTDSATPPMSLANQSALFHIRQGSSNSSGRGSRSPSITSNMSVASLDKPVVSSALTATTMSFSSQSSIASHSSVHCSEDDSAREDDGPLSSSYGVVHSQLACPTMTNNCEPSIVPLKTQKGNDPVKGVAPLQTGERGNEVSKSDRVNEVDPSDLVPGQDWRYSTGGTSQDDLDASDSCKTLTSAAEMDHQTSSPVKRAPSYRHEYSLRRRHSSASAASAGTSLEETRGIKRDDQLRSSLFDRVPPSSTIDSRGRLEDALSPSIVSVHMSIASLPMSGMPRERGDIVTSALRHGTSNDTLHNTNSGVFNEASAPQAASSQFIRPTSLIDDGALNSQLSSHDGLAAIEEPLQTPAMTPLDETPRTELGMEASESDPPPCTADDEHRVPVGAITEKDPADISLASPAVSPNSSFLSMKLSPITPSSESIHARKSRSSSSFSSQSFPRLTSFRRSRSRRGSSDAESVSSPSEFRYVGRVVPSRYQNVNQKLIQTRAVELHRPASGKYGFYIKQRAARSPIPHGTTSSGFFVSRFATEDVRKLLAGMIEEGDQILSINGISLSPAGSRVQVSMEDVVQLMRTSDKLDLVIAPNLELEDW